MTKVSLRKAILEELKKFAENRERASRDLMTALTQHPAYSQARILATYLSLPHEIDTTFLIEQALADGKQVVVPKVVGQGQMIFVPYVSDQLKVGAKGIVEPISYLAVDKAMIDLIHVPAVGFRSDGYRIGYGGGFYDRYLVDYEGLTLGTALDSQLCHFSIDNYDIPVKELIIYDTTKGVIQGAAGNHGAFGGQSAGFSAHELDFSLSGDQR